MKIITVTLAPNQAVLTCYLQDQSPKMPNAAIRPAMLVVPGGGYQYCSDREGEPVALAYMAQGFNAFVLRYTADATTPIDKALQDGLCRNAGCNVDRRWPPGARPARAG